MATDYKVGFRSYDNVAGLASEMRVRLGIDSYYVFNIVNQLRKLKDLKFGINGHLKIELFIDRKDKAYVTFDPLVLHVHKDIWDEADIGEPTARFIIAHELGHILMHRHYRQEFAETNEFYLKAFPPEEKAETQANWFAAAFLAPDYLARNCASESELCLNFDYPRDFISEKLHLFQTPKHKSGWVIHY
jgi:Zn-dependent peptidase ImmA (M78 family)